MQGGWEQKVKRSFFFERASQEERRKRTAELRRLLYVAMTRAEQAVYLVGSLALGDGERGEAFSTQIRNRIKEKIAAQNKAEISPIVGDRIIDDDTLFGLLLPAALDHLPEAVSDEPDTIKGSPCFFDLKVIPRYRKSQFFSATSQARKPPRYAQDSPGLTQFLTSLRPYYTKAPLISTPQVLPRHQSVTASSSGVAQGSAHLSPAYTGEGGADLFEPVDALLDRFAANTGTERFTPADFGTLAHACTEALLNGKEARIPLALAGYLVPAEAKALLSAGKALAARFIASPLGTIARTAIFRRSEYRFRSLTAEGIFIDGTIDLLFETQETVYVVDFKTDCEENPREHLPQMTWYYHAARALRKKPCETYLYYLRSGHSFFVQCKSV